MTLNTTEMRVEYIADGLSRVWSIPWKYSAAGDIKVKTKVNADAAEIDCVDVFVSGNVVSAPATLSTAAFSVGTIVIVERWVTLKQQDDYTNQGSFYPEDIEASFDRNYMALQQMNYQVDKFWGAYETIDGTLQTISDYNNAASASAWAASGSASAATVAQTASEAARDAAVGAKSAAEAARAAAETAAGVAQTAKTGAEAAKSGAESAKTSAQGAQTAAETAKTGAVTAQTASEAARDAAVGAKTAAETARGAAETAAGAAQTAKTGAESAKSGAESAKTSAQGAQTAAETAKTGAVTAQTASEAARDAAVGAKTAAEAARGAAETAAGVAQTAKTVAEAAEAAAETASAAAQIARTGAETAATSAAGSASAASISASNAESSASSLSYATQAEVDLGGDVAKIVSPATLKKGAAGGVAELNANTKIPAERLYITGALADGAIIESGENANGRYTKFADGTMICWCCTFLTGVTISSAYINGIYTGIFNVTFPCQFIDGNVGISLVGIYDTGASWSTYVGLSTSGYSVRIIDAVARNAPGNYTYSYLAVGRWKA